VRFIGIKQLLIRLTNSHNPTGEWVGSVISESCEQWQKQNVTKIYRSLVNAESDARL